MSNIQRRNIFREQPRPMDQIQADIRDALTVGDNDKAIALQCELAEINRAALQAEFDAINAYTAKQAAKNPPALGFRGATSQTGAAGETPPFTEKLGAHG